MFIKQEKFLLNDIPAILWGEFTNKIYLYVHGQGGCKEEAGLLADLICGAGWQVLSIDLPGHGSRKDVINSFDPWHVVPELVSVLKFAEAHSETVSLFANSIGAWFSMLSFKGAQIKNCMFVSPVTDMKSLILKMMRSAGISLEQLQKERIITTSSGQIFSLDYWNYVLKNPVTDWNVPTKILYGGKDNLIDRCVIEKFCENFNCSLTVMENGEHWFHTEEQLDFTCNWIKRNIGK